MAPPAIPTSLPETASARARKNEGQAFGVGCVRLPRGEQLPLTTREKLTSAYDAEWVSLLAALRKDLADYGSDDQIASHFEYEATQLSRVLNGKANPPGWLIAFAIWRCKGRHFVAAACDLACGDFLPRPPPDEAEENARIVAAVRERGLLDAARKWAGLVPVEPTDS